MITPCVKTCVMNPNTNKCIGCYRTLEEIQHWGHYTDEQRSNIMNRVLDESFSNYSNTNNG
jgi:predicted Fe-S protein YdhL (DUF1289 family)